MADSSAAIAMEVCGEEAMEILGRTLAECLTAPAVLFLEGDLGAGKTTLARGLVRGFGHSGSVKSPTYTLVEPYTLGDLSLFHFDLYRLADPEELEWMGIREYFADNSICVVEWPKNGLGVLPDPDIKFTIGKSASCRHVLAESLSSRGVQMLLALRQRIGVIQRNDIRITS